MNEPSGNDSAEARVKALVDHALLESFWRGVVHYNTIDLVLFLDQRKQAEPVVVYPRERTIADKSVPAALRAMLSKSARSAASPLSFEDTAFWFVVLFQDEGMACAAITAKPIAPVGAA